MHVLSNIISLCIQQVYRNFSKPKGLALVINNRDFYGPKTNPLPNRLGTDVDATNSAKLWRNFGYEVNQVENLTGEQLLREMARFALDSRHAKSDSAVVVMLSHGGHGGIYGVDGELVEIDRLVMCLNALHCPALIDKPKLIIIQACRGGELKEAISKIKTNGIQ